MYKRAVFFGMQVAHSMEYAHRMYCLLSNQIKLQYAGLNFYINLWV